MRHFLYGFVAGALLPTLPWPFAPYLLLKAGACVAALIAGGLLFGRLVASTRCGAPGSTNARGGHGCRSGRTPVSKAPLVLLFGAVSGLGWSAMSHEALFAARVQPGGSGNAIPMVIRIVSDPVPVAGALRELPAFRFVAKVQESRGRQDFGGKRLRLSWYGVEQVQRGETWRVAAVVRPPWGYANPGGFDFERWLTGQGIHGTGTIRRGVRESPAQPGPIEATRARLAAFVASLDLRYGPVLAAQLVGVTGGIAQGQWELFRATGTIHLMVISGLHIALAAAMGFAIGRWACRLCPLLFLWLDARKAGAGCGVVAAVGYLALAGGGLPAVRACIMAAPALLLLAWGRRCRAGPTVLVGLALVLALEPLAIHQQGFWLSFAAVALLVLGFGGRYGERGVLGTLVRTQWLLTVAMAPLLVVLTGSVPLAGFVANLLAVPAVSVLVVPLTLAGGALADGWPVVGALCFRAADAVLVPLFAFLEWCAAAPLLNTQPDRVTLSFALCAGVLWLIGATGGQRALLLLCLTTTLLPPGSGIEPGEFRVLALDVGQGDAIVVDTARHRLLFDAGPAFPGGFDTGSAVVVPSLLATGVGTIDALVLSHADLDHVGGASAVVQGLRVRRVYASFSWPRAAACGSQSWTWDGVRFRFLDVPRPRSGAKERGGNEDSCILLVDDGRRRALLAGDIGAAVEGRLLRSLDGPVDLLFAPHHGSRTSSSRGFVRFAQPSRVFVSAGRDNRYGHPHPQVLARYHALGAAVFETARAGALTWESGAPERARGARDGSVPYWRGSAAVAGN